MGHNGYGHTRGSGRLPRPSFAIPYAAAIGEAEFSELARQVADAAAKIGMSVKDTLTRMRDDKIVECDDAAFAILLDAAEKVGVKNANASSASKT